MKESHKLVPPISDTLFLLINCSNKLQYSQIVINAILFIHFQIVNRMANMSMLHVMPPSTPLLSGHLRTSAMRNRWHDKFKISTKLIVIPGLPGGGSMVAYAKKRTVMTESIPQRICVNYFVICEGYW